MSSPRKNTTAQETTTTTTAPATEASSGGGDGGSGPDTPQPTPTPTPTTTATTTATTTTNGKKKRVRKRVKKSALPQNRSRLAASSGGSGSGGGGATTACAPFRAAYKAACESSRNRSRADPRVLSLLSDATVRVVCRGPDDGAVWGPLLDALAKDDCLERVELILAGNGNSNSSNSSRGRGGTPRKQANSARARAKAKAFPQSGGASSASAAHETAVSRARKEFVDALAPKLAYALCSLLHNSTALTTLIVEGFTFSPKSTKLLAKGVGASTSLCSLSLARSNMGDARFAVLLPALRHSTSLREINLSECRLTDRAGVQIAVVLHSQALRRYTRIWESGLRDRDVAAHPENYMVAEAVRTAHGFSSVTLADNELGDATATAIGHALASESWVERLDLSGNAIGDSGAESLLACLSESCVVELNLERNPIRGAVASGAESVATLNAVRVSSLAAAECGGGVGGGCEGVSGQENSPANGGGCGDDGYSRPAPFEPSHSAVKLPQQPLSRQQQQQQRTPIGQGGGRGGVSSGSPRTPMDMNESLYKIIDDLNARLSAEVDARRETDLRLAQVTQSLSILTQGAAVYQPQSTAPATATTTPQDSAQTAEVLDLMELTLTQLHAFFDVVETRVAEAQGSGVA